MEADSTLKDDDLDVQMLEKKDDDESMDDDCLSIRSTDTMVRERRKKPRSNPVEECCIQQLHSAQAKVHEVCSNIEMIDGFTNKVLDTLSTKAAYREDASSESDSDVSLYIHLLKSFLICITDCV